MNDIQIFETAFTPVDQLSNESLFLEHLSQIEQVFQFDPILSAVPNPVIILNKMRQIVYANLAFLKLLNVSDSRDLIGLRLGDAVKCIHASEEKGVCGTTEFCSECGAAKATRKALRGQADIQECRILAQKEKAVSALDLRVWTTPFHIGDEMFTIFSMVDIGDEKRRRMLERIFFHDITNTATAIQGLVEMFIFSENPAELVELSVDKMLANASVQLIDEIQAQAQLMEAESAELAIQPEPFETKTFLQQIVDLYRPHRVAEERLVQLAEPTVNVLIWSDWGLLGRVIGNMVKNALEASSPGETVTVGCEDCSDSVRFWVHNPMVMPRQVQLQVFHRSFSTKGDGRGLGTYSMKLLGETYLQGCVSFESTPEKGTVFMFTCKKEWRGKDPSVMSGGQV